MDKRQGTSDRTIEYLKKFGIIMAITVVLVIVSVILIKHNTEGARSVRYAAFIAVCEVKSAGFFNALSKTVDWLSAIAGLACMGIYCFNVIT